MKLAAERGGVSLIHNIAPEASHIFADRRAIKQILVNLLSNGIKFTPRGGQVALEARVNHQGVEILVRDTGTGIASADLEKLGKPFEQAEHAAMGAKEGTGLGLALVKSLAACMAAQLCWNRRWGRYDGKGPTAFCRAQRRWQRACHPSRNAAGRCLGFTPSARSRACYGHLPHQRASRARGRMVLIKTNCPIIALLKLGRDLEGE